MRLTRVMCRQHIDRMFNKHWKMQRRRVPVETGAEAELRQLGLPLTNPLEMIQEKSPPIEPFPDVIGTVPKPVPFDEKHPFYHQRSCYMYNENNVLIEGLKQAQVLINAVEVKQGLPVVIEDLKENSSAKLPENIDELVKRCVMGAHLFDAYQEKLPIIKDPARPAFTFPRVYGIPDYRRNRVITDRLLSLCGTLSHGAPGLVLHDTPIRVYMERDDDLYSWNVKPGVLLSSATPLPPHANTTSVQATESSPLPDISPLKSTVSIQTSHFYEDKELFPLQHPCTFPHIHTAVFYFNETEVKNLHEEPVIESQILGRTLTQTFAAALAIAKQRFGKKLKENNILPEPVTLQGIQTDGRQFHFVVLQLNTLASQGVHNIIWSSPLLPLFSLCEYDKGVPVLKKYNSKVFSNLLAFYNNGNRRSIKK